MKKIYVQKRMFILMNLFSLVFALVGLCDGLFVDKSFLYLLFVSLGLSVLSLLFLINKICYTNEEIIFSFIYKKTVCKYQDVKEVFLQYDLMVGMKVIFNLGKQTDENCFDYLEYTKILKRENIKNYVGFVGGSKREIEQLLKRCHCPIKGLDY